MVPLKNKVDTILVIGGAGYIGSVLARMLLDSGYHVRILDKLQHGSASMRDLCRRPEFELIEGDLGNVGALVPAIQGTDAVIQLATAMSGPASSLDYEVAVDVNTYAVRTIQQVCRSYGIHRFLLASTYEAYRARSQFISEESELAPRTLCARSVVAAERVALNVSPNEPKPTILRMASPFGLSYRMRFDLPVNYLTARAVAEGEITIVNEQRWQPFVHVTDIARAALACLQVPAEQVEGKTYNVGDCRLNPTLGQLGDIVASVVPRTRVLKKEVTRDLPSYRIDFSRIAHDLDFECPTSLEDGIDEIATELWTGRFGDYRDSVYGNVAALKEEVE